jgi:hypothetical protein
VEKTKTETDDSEEVKYVHKCECGHLIGTHLYSFKCTDDQHLYSMECELCGNGEEEQEIYVGDD